MAAAPSIRFLRAWRLLSGLETLPLGLQGLVHLLLRLLQGFLRLLELLLPRRGAGGRGAHRFDAAAGQRGEREQHGNGGESSTESAPFEWKKVTSYFGRLSMTRLALPIERSMVPIFTSALMPT